VLRHKVYDIDTRFDLINRGHELYSLGNRCAANKLYQQGPARLP
jgi:hypothetical protein